MPKLFTKTIESRVSFCERCASVCDAACRREALLEHARSRALLYAWRAA